MKKRLFYLFLLGCFAAGLAVIGLPVVRGGSAKAQSSYQMAWGVLPAGGGLSSGGQYTAQSTIGIPVSGVSSGGAYRLEAGVVYSMLAPVAYLPLVQAP